MEFLLCGLKLSCLGQVGKQMSISFFLLWLCLLLHLPKNEYPEQESCHQGLGAVPSTYPVEGAYACLLLCLLP